MSHKAIRKWRIRESAQKDNSKDDFREHGELLKVLEVQKETTT